MGAQEHAHSGPVVRKAAELRALLAKEDPEDSLILREEPPEHRRKKDWRGMKSETNNSHTTYTKYIDTINLAW
jgi:hypothetical protein